MAELTFENNASQRVYNRALKLVDPKADKEKAREIFARHAVHDGKPVLSTEEARQVESILKHYDKMSSFQIGVYNTQELEAALAAEEAEEKAQQLFNLAYKYDKTSGKLVVNHDVFEELVKFIDETARMGVVNSKLVEIARRINPKLKLEDHKLIFELEGATSPTERAAVAGRIMERIKELTHKEVEGYDGIVSTNSSAAFKRLDAFWWALSLTLNGDEQSVDKELGEYNFEITMQYAQILVDDFSFISDSDGGVVKKASLLNYLANFVLLKSRLVVGKDPVKQKKLAKLYKEAKAYILKNRETLLSMIEDASYALDKAALGTSQKIMAYRRKCLLYDIALVSGIPVPQIETRSLTASLPGIDLKSELPILASMGETAASPEKFDDYSGRDGVLHEIGRVAGLYNRRRDAYFKNPTAQNQIAFSSTEKLLGVFIDFALKFGCEDAKVQEVLFQHGVLSAPAAKGLDLQTQRAARIAPKDLPEDVVKILKQVGVYEEICRDVVNVYLAEEIYDKSAKRIVGGASGVASTDTRSIWVDFKDSSGGRVKSFEIAVAVIHEWLHVRWGIENRGNIELLRSTPNERNSFLGEARHMKTHMRKLIAEHKTEVEEYQRLSSKANPDESEQARILQLKQGVIGDILVVSSTIASSAQIGMSANAVLGYDLDDINPNTKLSESSDELDLDTYPSNLNGAYSTQIDELISSSALKGEEAQKVKALYGRILAGEVYIAGDLGYENGELKQKVYLVDKAPGKFEEISGYFAPIVPIQVHYKLQPTGIFGNDPFYYSIYMSENMLYQSRREQFDSAIADFNKYLAGALKGIGSEEDGQIANIVADVLNNDYISVVGLGEYLKTFSFMLMGKLVQNTGFSHRAVDLAIKMLTRLAAYNIIAPAGLDARQIEVYKLIWRRATGSTWRIDKEFLQSVFAREMQKKILAEAGWPQ